MGYYRFGNSKNEESEQTAIKIPCSPPRFSVGDYVEARDGRVGFIAKVYSVSKPNSDSAKLYTYEIQYKNEQWLVHMTSLMTDSELQEKFVRIGKTVFEQPTPKPNIMKTATMLMDDMIRKEDKVRNDHEHLHKAATITERDRIMLYAVVDTVDNLVRCHNANERFAAELLEQRKQEESK